MNRIYVDYPKLRAGAADMAAHQKSFVEVLGQLESDLAPMIATWSGEARDLYLQKKQLWDNAARDIALLLTHISTITQDAHDNYAQAVSELAAAWQ